MLIAQMWLVSVGRQPTGNRNDFQSSDTAVKALTHRDGKRCWSYKRVGNIKRACTKKVDRNQAPFALIVRDSPSGQDLA